MKPAPSFSLTALATACLCACGTTPKSGVSGLPPIAPVSATPVSLTELSALQNKPDVKFDKVRVSMEVVSRKKSQSVPLPDITVRRGQPATVAQIREFPYPGDFEFPKIKSAAAKTGSSAVTPATPRNFLVRNTGLTVAFTATARGPFIMLKGTVTDSQCDRLNPNPGSIFSPLSADDGTVLTDNKCLSPQFTDRITHFYLAALPGQPLAFPLNSAKAGTTLQITASLTRAQAKAVTRSLKVRRGSDTGEVVVNGRSSSNHPL